MLVIRCESSLLYFNVEYVRERLSELLAGRPDGVRLVIFFLGAVPRVDLAGAELLADLHRTFGARAIEFRLAEAHGEVRAALRRIGLDREHGPLESGQTVDAVLSQWQAGSCTVSLVPSRQVCTIFPRSRRSSRGRPRYDPMLTAALS